MVQRFFNPNDIYKPTDGFRHLLKLNSLRPYMPVTFVKSSPLAEFYYEQHLIFVFNVSGTALLVFDYFLLLEKEVKLVWSAKWGIGKWLYVLSRYLVFLDIFAVDAYNLSLPAFAKEITVCGALIRAVTFFHLLGILVAEIVLSLRTWALWDKSRVVGYSLVGLLTGFGLFLGIRGVEYTNGLNSCNPALYDTAGFSQFIHYSNVAQPKERFAST
ncbi:hypothetical protein M422DRAFT_239560 [Sphaerobolus stellatus SS14]|nr:hypothetical protein M422DRAFT_239560 [Sphaerobolus stellatus SS14]